MGELIVNRGDYFWGLSSQSLVHAFSETKCTQLQLSFLLHYTYWLFSLCNSLIGYEYIFTHMRIQREQNTCIGGKMRFVVHRAVKETFIARK